VSKYGVLTYLHPGCVSVKQVGKDAAESEEVEVNRWTRASLFIDNSYCYRMVTWPLVQTLFRGRDQSRPVLRPVPSHLEYRKYNN
jgi:hypothetical protein